MGWVVFICSLTLNCLFADYLFLAYFSIFFFLPFSAIPLLPPPPPSLLSLSLQVETHFEDFVDDQFDFHSYCLRKGTLRSYSSALLMTDTLPHHVAYQRALCGLVATYVELHDMGHKERVAIAKVHV